MILVKEIRRASESEALTEMYGVVLFNQKRLNMKWSGTKSTLTIRLQDPTLSERMMIDLID